LRTTRFISRSLTLCRVPDYAAPGVCKHFVAEGFLIPVFP
jgi:hypothetical protein